MNCQFIKVWVIEGGDGYTTRPVAYFSSQAQAEIYMQDKRGRDNWWSINRNPLDAIQVGDEVYLLGEKVDVDHAEEKKREALINSAKAKLSAEELAAIIGPKIL